MITEDQQDQAGLFALGMLPENERVAFLREMRANAELRELTRDFVRAADALALAVEPAALPAGLKISILRRIGATADASRREGLHPPGLSFLVAADSSPWKPLPVPGAWIKLLSLERERGYAVLLGKLDPGARFPAHLNVGPEDFYVLTGDLHIGATRLSGGDFHHAERGSWHEENYSENGCTLLAVLTVDDPLVGLALA